MARAVGIDLGTTNSAIAVLEGGEPTIPNAEGGRTTLRRPLQVRRDPRRRDRQAPGGHNVDRTISSVKRHMRRSIRRRRQEVHRPGRSAPASRPSS